MSLLLCGVGLEGFVRVLVVNIGCQNRLLAIHASLLLRSHSRSKAAAEPRVVGGSSNASSKATQAALFQHEKHNEKKEEQVFKENT